MTRRAGRSFDVLSEAQIVAGRTAGRRVAPQLLGPAENPRPIAQLLDTIQHVAEAATGERSFLHVPPTGGAEAFTAWRSSSSPGCRTIRERPISPPAARSSSGASTASAPRPARNNGPGG